MVTLNRNVCEMAVCDWPSAMSTIMLHITDWMCTNVLVAFWNSSTIASILENRVFLHELHLKINSILPKGVAIFLVQSNSFIVSLWHLHTTLELGIHEVLTNLGFIGLCEEPTLPFGQSLETLPSRLAG